MVDQRMSPPGDEVEETNGYGQYCPMTRALELLGERWTLLIVRDLLVAPSRFNDLARGLPGISRTLLSRRLRKLQRGGVVEHDGSHYRMTPAGQELEPIVFGLGEWGARWAFGDPREDELDPEVLLWWAHGRIDATGLPDRRTVIAFDLSEPTFRAWLLVDDHGVELCKSDPGFDVDATVVCTVHTLARVWLGRIGVRDALRGEDLTLSGRREIVRAIPDALELSPMARLVRNAHPAG